MRFVVSLLAAYKLEAKEFNLVCIWNIGFSWRGKLVALLLLKPLVVIIPSSTRRSVMPMICPFFVICHESKEK